MASVAAYHCYANLCNAGSSYRIWRSDHLSSETSAMGPLIGIGMKRARLILGELYQDWRSSEIRIEYAILGDLLLLAQTKKAIGELLYAISNSPTGFALHILNGARSGTRWKFSHWAGDIDEVVTEAIESFDQGTVPETGTVL